MQRSVLPLDRCSPLILTATQRDLLLYSRHGDETFSSGGLVDASKAFLGDDQRTTIMVKRIPRKLTCAELSELLDRINGVQGSYNFLHIPWDHNRQTSRGFAFVNFTSCLHVGIFADALTTGNVPEALRNCELRYARIQGTAESLHQLVKSEQPLLMKHSIYAGG
jgi:hypothetical protein